MTRLIPMFPVRNIGTSIGFYQKLGFIVEQRRDDWGWAIDDPDGNRLWIGQLSAPSAG